jgi:DNA-binding winged helix-turn-helix (wHTH) protein
MLNSDFRVGPWLVQPSLNTISQNGTSNRVEPKMMEVLVCLAEHTGEVVPKEKLLQVVWPDTFVSDDVLKRSVSYAAYLGMTPTSRGSLRPFLRGGTGWS